MWVKRELLYALQTNRFDNKIVPIVYQYCDYEKLSWVLPSFQMINFQEDTFENVFPSLLGIWGIGYKMPH